MAEVVTYQFYATRMAVNTSQTRKRPSVLPVTFPASVTWITISRMKHPFPICSAFTTSNLSIIRFRSSTVQRELRQLNPSKATGSDNVPARVLKACAASLATPLARLFSLCFRQGKQPDMWKLARVVAVHKRKSKSVPQNYRPISLLSIISKVMESIVNPSVVNFLERHSLLSATQFGFRRGLGTADLLTQLTYRLASTAGHGGVARA